jgi:hypothetical protein
MAAGTRPRNSGELTEVWHNQWRRAQGPSFALATFCIGDATAALASPAEAEDISLPVKCAILV